MSGFDFINFIVLNPESEFCESVYCVQLRVSLLALLECCTFRTIFGERSEQSLASLETTIVVGELCEIIGEKRQKKDTKI